MDKGKQFNVQELFKLSIIFKLLHKIIPTFAPYKQWTDMAEKDNKIAPQTEVVKVGAGDGAQATHTQEIEFVVNEAGDGTLVFTAPEKNAPQLDKI